MKLLRGVIPAAMESHFSGVRHGLGLNDDYKPVH